MKKSIIALVIAGLPLAASAEVILYGQIKSSVTVGQVKIKGDAGSETSSTATSINDNTSRIGFKGSENLGGDLKAIWQVEQKQPLPAVPKALPLVIPSSVCKVNSVKSVPVNSAIC